MIAGCGGDFSSLRGLFLSPNYPNSIPAFSHCIWRITAPNNHYISLRFTEFIGLNGTNANCPFDRVQILDGFTNEAQLLGEKIFIVTSICYLFNKPKQS